MKILSKAWLLVFLLPFNVFAGADDSLTIFDQTTELVTKNFYDKSFRGLPWARLVKDARKSLAANSSDKTLETVLNQLLDRLHASHTEFLSSTDQEFWALESIFSGQLDGAPLSQIGAWFILDKNKWFIRDVFEASPAALAGLLPGDEVVSVNGPFP